jgi:hypothetical protein
VCPAAARRAGRLSRQHPYGACTVILVAWKTPGMAKIDPENLSDDLDDVSLDDLPRRDQDGVDSLQDTEAEAGDEDELLDDYDLDDREAKELGVQLDDRDEPEPTLD